MRIGVALPTNRIALRDGELGRIAVTLEDAGCDAVWVNDHLAAFPAGTDHYPYTPTGIIDWDPYAPQYEALTACAYLLGATRRLRVGTSVLVVPQRHPVEVAKAVATLADLGAGRFVLGVGAGWSHREMRLLGWDPATRGARLDEQLDFLRATWDPDRPLPSLTHYDVPPDVIMRPVPRRSDVPAILIGGNSPAALRRACARGDGWFAVSGPEPDQLRAVAAQRARLPPNLTAVLKIAVDTPDAGPAALAFAREGDWDEVVLEFGAWDLDGALSVLDKRC